ncbi:MAG: MBL fold metallo-hydrolase [Terriglobales bacterium]
MPVAVSLLSVPLTVSILASGSQGNAAVIATERTTLLLDVGLSRRELLRRLALCGIPPQRLQAVLITHEHSDHVAGLPRLAAQLSLPIYINGATRAALGAAGATLERVEAFAAGGCFQIGDIEVSAFAIPHDAADPVGFRFCAAGVQVVFATDLGYLPENVCQQLAHADCAVIESNHDLEMLKNGGYPWELKQRVLGRLGHLSNACLAEFLGRGFDGSAAHLVLAHLSENNNLPSLARLSAERALAARRWRPQVHVAAQAEPLAPITL